MTSLTDIEIQDPDPSESDPVEPDGAAGGQGEAADGEPNAAESPYRNLLVPLVVVPALIVMVIVLVVAFFSMVTGKEDSPHQNLERVLNGGFNERKQAAFNLVQQMLALQQAEAAGQTPEWSIDESFLPALRQARASVGPIQGSGDVPVPFLLASLLARLGDPEGLEELVEMTHLAPELDPQGEYRWYAALTLTSLGPRADEPERARVLAALLELTQSEDQVLALTALAGLQRLPGEATLAALRGELTGSDLARRGTAALSLATLGDPGGVAVLQEMLGEEPYAAEREAEPRRWPPRLVSESRCKALAALGELGRLPDEAVMRRLAEEDPDPNVRRTALELRGPREPASASGAAQGHADGS